MITCVKVRSCNIPWYKWYIPFEVCTMFFKVLTMKELAKASDILHFFMDF